MNRLKIAAAGAVVTASAVAGGFIAGIMGPSTVAVNAATNAATTTASPDASPSPGAFKSNEDPAHEKSESAARESDEDSGRAHLGRRGFGRHGSNETPGHEATESAAHEAQENASPSPTPSP